MVSLEQAKVMGILNLTPDSFYDGGSLKNEGDVLRRAEQMLEEGATFLDLGAYSSRPGAQNIATEEEWARMESALKSTRKEFPDAILSIDTFRAEVADRALDCGADMINDISAGKLDPGMLDLVSERRVPYCGMHMQGDPQNMQTNPHYEDVVQEVYKELSELKFKLSQANFSDLIIDPGFGFGKTVEHNYALLNSLETFQAMERPILVGFSRKSMIGKILNISKLDSLNGTTILNTIALIKGASILRVHDVKEAVEAVSLFGAMQSSDTTEIDILRS